MTMKSPTLVPAQQASEALHGRNAMSCLEE